MNNNYKKYFLKTLIITLSISAFIGIITFLIGNFGDREIKLLLTTLSIGAFSLTGLCSSVIVYKQGLKTFSIIGMIVSALAFFTTAVMIWGGYDFEVPWKLMFIFIVLSVSIAHVSLLLKMTPKNKTIKNILIGTVIFIALVALMLIKSIISNFTENEFYFRLLGVCSILDVLGTILLPILNRNKA